MHDHRISREMREADRLPPTTLAHWLWPWPWPFHWTVVRDTGVNVYLECPCGRRKVRTRPWAYQPIDKGWLDTGEWTPVPKRFPSARAQTWRPPREP